MILLHVCITQNVSSIHIINILYVVLSFDFQQYFGEKFLLFEFESHKSTFFHFAYIFIYISTVLLYCSKKIFPIW